MLYNKYLLILIFFICTNCTTENLNSNKPKLYLENNFTNKGFTLIYRDSLYKSKVITTKLDDRDLIIFQKNLKKGTDVKITNILNNKSILAKVGKNSQYPIFNNSVISKRIADEIELNVNEPYVRISAIPKNSLFIAKKAKTYDEEKKVAYKVPVNSISIDDLNIKKDTKKKKTNIKFSYIVKIADFYFYETAKLMLKRIRSETNIENVNIINITKNVHRVYLGPFYDIYSLQKSYNDIKELQFENIEIIKK